MLQAAQLDGVTDWQVSAAYRTLEYQQRLMDDKVADLMKTNHHGGYTSNENAWLDAVQPRAAFSCSNDNGCIRLIEELRRRGVDYVSTGCQGLLHFALSAEGEIEKTAQYDEMINIMRVN